MAILSRSFAAALALFQLVQAHADFTTTTTTTATATITTLVPTAGTASRLLPTAVPEPSTAEFNLTHSLIDEELFKLKIADRQFPVTCVDCSTSGSLEVFVHNAEANETSLFKQRKRDIDWPGPSGSLVARFPSGFKGRVELSLAAPATLSHEFTLAKWPLLGVAIPGFGQAGVVASLTIPLSLELTDEAELNFGFNFSIPRNASVNLHFPFIDESTSFGFKKIQGLRMDALPLELSVPGLDVDLTTGLRLKLEAGVSSSDDDFVVETGAMLDLPRIKVEERQLVNVDHTCRALTANASTAVTPSTMASTNVPLSTAVSPPSISSDNAPFSNLTSGIESLVGDYTHIAPSIGVGLDLYAQLKGEIVEIDVDKRTEIPIFGTTWPLPTVCIDNSPETSTSTTSSSSVATTSSASNGMDANRAAEPTATASSTVTTLSLPLPTNDADCKKALSGSVVALVLALAWVVIAM